MTREDWVRVKTITAAALEQPEARRPGFVTDACAGDQPLEQEVRSLLFSAVSASALFEAPVLATPSAINLIEQAAYATAPRIGGRFGPYRIIKEIGRGGMGRVFPRGACGRGIPSGRRVEDRARFAIRRRAPIAVSHRQIHRAVSRRRDHGSAGCRLACGRACRGAVPGIALKC